MVLTVVSDPKTLDEAIEAALNRSGSEPLAQKVKEEFFAMFADKVAWFMVRHIDNDEVISDFEQFLREIGAYRAGHH